MIAYISFIGYMLKRPLLSTDLFCFVVVVKWHMGWVGRRDVLKGSLWGYCIIFQQVMLLPKLL
jgi:hypothetical protein